MINTAALLWSLVFGSIGLAYFVYGKRQANMVARYTGIVLMIYPYFVDSTLAMVVIGVGLMFLPKFVKL